MSISRAIWQNPSRWNRFLITYDWTDITCFIRYVVTTQSLSLNVLTEQREYRHRLNITYIISTGDNTTQVNFTGNESSIIIGLPYDEAKKVIFG